MGPPANVSKSSQQNEGLRRPFGGENVSLIGRVTEENHRGTLHPRRERLLASLTSEQSSVSSEVVLGAGLWWAWRQRHQPPSTSLHGWFRLCVQATRRLGGQRPDPPEMLPSQRALQVKDQPLPPPTAPFCGQEAPPGLTTGLIH